MVTRSVTCGLDTAQLLTRAVPQVDLVSGADPARGTKSAGNRGGAGFPENPPPHKAILYAVHVLLTHLANQRRATGGKFRAADEAEAAGDDQVRVGIIAIQAVHCPMRKSFPTDSCRLSG